MNRFLVSRAQSCIRPKRSCGAERPTTHSKQVGLRPTARMARHLRSINRSTSSVVCPVYGKTWKFAHVDTA